MDDLEALLAIEPPRGMYPGRLDDKGRIKVPVQFQQYLTSLPEKKLFVTSLDRRIAQIYSMTLWRQNEKFFETFKGDPEAVSNVQFNANDLGAEQEMDAQGRIVFPPELRRELGIENGAVKIYASKKGRIEVLSESLYEESKRKASQGAPENVTKLAMAGLV